MGYLNGVIIVLLMSVARGRWQHIISSMPCGKGHI